MISPGLIVLLAAVAVAAQIAIAWWFTRNLEARITGRIDEMNRLVSALVRKVEEESALAMQALDETMHRDS